MGVAQHLDLDVTRMVQVTLQIDRTIPERGFRLPAGGFERPRQLCGLSNNPHALPPATGGSLH